MTVSEGPEQSGYGDAERVFATPAGGFDVEWVAAHARSQDPGLPEETAREMASAAWDHLRAVGKLDAPEVARRLMAEHPAVGASPAAVVAKAAVDFCDEHGVQV